MKVRNEQPSNPGNNPAFEAILATVQSRRGFLQAGMGAVAVSFFADGMFGMHRGIALAVGAEARPLPFSFKGVSTCKEDKVIVPDDYQMKVLYPWGDPVNGVAPAFKKDASNTADEQAQQAGMGHDGMQWFPQVGDSPDTSHRGVLCINHEYTDQGLLFTEGIADDGMTADQVKKSQAAHGVSVIAVARDAAGKWSVVKSAQSRRITANTEMKLTGPAAGSAWTRTAIDRERKTVLGTFSNCASGITPWGTYLTCEENFNGVFGTETIGFQPSVDQRRYGLTAKGYAPRGTRLYQWWKHDERFNLAQHPHEPNRFGYVVEIDPTNATSTPVKHTALGRLKHENAAVVTSKDQRIVIYMGDDEKNEYIYKFVSAGKYNATDRAANLRLLEDGTLYVARFNSDKTGDWLELTLGKNGLTKRNGFEAPADICVRTRQAADLVGATMMDRPEWIAVHPSTKEVFVTLSNNDQRGQLPPSRNSPDGTAEAGKSQPPVDAANSRTNSVYGHILRWKEADGDPAAASFIWDHFLLAGDPHLDGQVSVRGDSLGSPDGLSFDRRGILWIQTDASKRNMASPPYQNLGNNMMLAADPVSRTVRRFLTGPNGCEVTGMAMTPDLSTMFVNIQHPGEPESDLSDPKKPMAISCWPDGPDGGRPRSATIVITRTDGRVIGT